MGRVLRLDQLQGTSKILLEVGTTGRFLRQQRQHCYKSVALVYARASITSRSSARQEGSLLLQAATAQRVKQVHLFFGLISLLISEQKENFSLKILLK